MNFCVLLVCVFVVFPYAAHGKNLEISVSAESNYTIVTVPVYDNEDLRVLFKTNQPTQFTPRCRQLLSMETLLLKLSNNGEGISYILNLKQALFTEGQWLCSFESKTETKYIGLNIFIIYEVRMTIFNKLINTVYTYTTSMSNYYYKEGDELQVSCLKPDMTIKGERKYSASLLSLKFYRTNGKETYANVKSLNLTEKDNGSVLLCANDIHGYQWQQRIETSVKLVLVAGHASTTTSPAPTIKMPEVTSQIAETSPTRRRRRPKMPRVTTESIRRETSESTTESTDTVYNSPTWLLPVAASVSTILIVGTILIGGLCVYCHAKRLTPRPPAQPPIVQQSINERVYYNIYEDHTYTYIDPAELRTVDTPLAQTLINNTK